MGMIFVENRNAELHTDMFDGEEYSFPPKQKVAISEEAAQHFFGYGLKDKTNILQRLGWASRYNPTTRQLEDNPEGVKKLANFVFSKAVLVSEDSLPGPELEIA